MSVHGFDSLDDMFKKVEEQMRRADSQVQDWQATIRPGDYFCRQADGIDLPIYGQVLEEDEPREQHLQNYRLCRCYSVMCPQGEMGDVHVSTIVRLLSDAEFIDARDRGWR